MIYHVNYDTGEIYQTTRGALEDFLRVREVKPLKDAGQNTEQAGEPEEVKE